MEIPFDLMKRVYDLMSHSDLGIEDALAAERGPGVVSPSVSLVYVWLRESKELQELAARAKANQADWLADQLIKIAKNPLETVVVKRIRRKDGTEITKIRTDNTQRSRLHFDAIRIRIGQLSPKRYGEAMILRGDRENPIEVISREEAIGKLLGHREAQKPD